MSVVIKFKKLTSNAIIPKFKTKGAACFDLHMCSPSIMCAEHDETIIIKTGLACEIPKGYEMQIRCRSSIAKSGVSVLNSPGTIDCDYRGEICVIIHNHTQGDFIIQRGDRIAQGAIRKIPDVEIIEVNKLSETERGEGRFGSTGV